jgi:hypothetical protein
VAGRMSGDGKVIPNNATGPSPCCAGPWFAGRVYGDVLPGATKSGCPGALTWWRQGLRPAGAAGDTKSGGSGALTWWRQVSGSRRRGRHQIRGFWRADVVAPGSAASRPRGRHQIRGSWRAVVVAPGDRRATRATSGRDFPRD